MRITHLVPALTKGGGERVAATLANTAAAAGHAVTIVAGFRADPTLLQEALHPDIVVKFINPAERFKILRYLAIGPWLLRNWFWLRDQDVVHCHLTFAAILGSAIQFYRRITRSRRPAVVETFHAVGMPIKPWQRMLSARLAIGRDGYVLMAEDPYWRNFAAQHRRLPIAIIPNGIELPVGRPRAEDVRAFREQLGIAEGRPVVGTIGRIVAERAPLTLLRAVAEVARQRPDVVFLFGGDGLLLSDLRAAADQFGFGDRLLTPGLIKNPSLAMAAMTVYVSINVGPVTGIAGLEAVALGVPVVAYQTLPEYRVGNADWIWSDHDPAVVGTEVGRLIADEHARDTMVRRQRAYLVDHHSGQAMFDAYLRLYSAAGAV